MVSEGLSFETLLRLIAASGVGGVVTWLAGFLWNRQVHRDAVAEKSAEREDRINEHGGKLLLEILAQLRGELAETNEELRTAKVERALQDNVASKLESRLAHFDEAITHITELVETNDPDKLHYARVSGRMFLERMQRLSGKEIA